MCQTWMKGKYAEKETYLMVKTHGLGLDVPLKPIHDDDQKKTQIWAMDIFSHKHS